MRKEQCALHSALHRSQAKSQNIAYLIQNKGPRDMSGEGEETNKKGFRLLWILDVQNVPCARESLLYGTGSGIALGLLHFLATSRVRRSYDVGFGGFFVTTLGSWFYCRINNARLRSQERMIQQGLRNRMIYQGTDLDPNTDPKENPPQEPPSPPHKDS